jgi:HSP20 family molecular chaperone IbpA
MIYIYLILFLMRLFQINILQRSFGTVRRVIRLPKGADQDNAQANLADGVLTINFPKLAIENGGGKKIPLVTGGPK